MHNSHTVAILTHILVSHTVAIFTHIAVNFIYCIFFTPNEVISHTVTIFTYISEVHFTYCDYIHTYCREFHIL